jgi:uncharacterized protein with HEPN domain
LRSDRERLFDILDAIERIEAQAARARSHDLCRRRARPERRDPLGRDHWRSRRGLSDELRQAHPEVPWRQ